MTEARRHAVRGGGVDMRFGAKARLDQHNQEDRVIRQPTYKTPAAYIQDAIDLLADVVPTNSSENVDLANDALGQALKAIAQANEDTLLMVSGA